MKKLLSAIAVLCMAHGMAAQGAAIQLSEAKALTWYDVQTPFTVTSIQGQTVDLQAWMDSGFCVIIDFSATWCYPCWLLHNSGLLEDIFAEWGPRGTNQLRMAWVETQRGTTVNSLRNGSFGDWTKTRDGEDVPYPILLSPTAAGSFAAGDPGYIPFVVFLTPEGKYTSIYNDVPDIVLDPDDMPGTMTRIGDMINAHAGRPAGIAAATLAAIRAYPNPATDRLHIEAEGLVRADLYDMVGRLVLSTTERDINLQGLRPAVYMLVVTTADGKAVSQIIKQ